MNIDKISMVQELLAFALLNEKTNLIDLLRRNGIDVAYEASDDEVLVATLNASAKSVSFKNELTEFLTNMTVENADTFTSFSGNEEDFFNGDGKSTLSKIGSWFGTNILTKENLNAGIGLGITSMNNKSQRKADEAAANLEQIRLQKLAMEKSGSGGSGNQGGGDGKKKTMMWVLVGVGVIALATGVFFYMKKKGKV
jgi:hypothetical protein